MKKWLVCMAVLLTGCVTTTPPTIVHQPMTVRPTTPPSGATSNGSIFQAQASRPLFEDRRARAVGDIITINLVESSTASKESSSSANRTSNLNSPTPTVAGLPGKSLQAMELSSGGDSTVAFSGDGASKANNVFRGTITVTVIEVFPNGNLLVSGEKKLALNQGGEEFIRFSGVVNPSTVTGGNTVQSTQVADARMEYRQNGYIDSAQNMGWLSRFFMSIAPF